MDECFSWKGIFKLHELVFEELAVWMISKSPLNDFPGVEFNDEEQIEGVVEGKECIDGTKVGSEKGKPLLFDEGVPGMIFGEIT